jgi:ATPase subunit of ABC transporter with duplicated ATPase domains
MTRLARPTNHLVPPSVERLETALVAYPGALVVATHDEVFAARVARTAWRIAGGSVEVSASHFLDAAFPETR